MKASDLIKLTRKAQTSGGSLGFSDRIKLYFLMKELVKSANLGYTGLTLSRDSINTNLYYYLKSNGYTLKYFYDDEGRHWLTISWV